VKVYQVLLIYQYLSLSGYQVLLQQSQEAYQVLEFWEMFLTHDPTRGSTQPMDNSESRDNMLYAVLALASAVFVRISLFLSTGLVRGD